MNKLKDHQRLNEHNEIWVIKRIIDGKSYDEVYHSHLRDAFISRLYALNLINEGLKERELI